MKVQDPHILLSIVNMKLRDFYPDLAALCGDMGIDEPELCRRLLKVGYVYQPHLRQFTASGSEGAG